MSSLINEFALTPDVFDARCYSDPVACDIHLQNLKKTLLDEALVRDLRDGGWRAFIAANLGRCDMRGKELFKKLVVQRRLCPAPAALPADPGTDAEWCAEAIESSKLRALDGILVSQFLKHSFSSEGAVASVERLTSASWWANRSSHMRVQRSIQGYLEALGPILRHANSVAFIDRYLDPTGDGFRSFYKLLEPLGDRTPRPLLELHRVVYDDPREKRFPTGRPWAERFGELASSLEAWDLQAEIFIWDDFHERFVISDIAGITLGNSLNTTTDPNAHASWCRLDRIGRDEIQAEFDPATRMHQLRDHFTIPSKGS